MNIPKRFPAKTEYREHFRKYGTIYILSMLMLLLMAGTVVYTTMIPREIYATINGVDTHLVTKEYIVEDALQDADISYCDEDYLSVDPGAYVTDGMYLELVNARNYTVTVDGSTKKYKSLCNTVGMALKEEKITVGNLDIVEPDVDEVLQEGASIVIKRVVIKEKTVTESIKFKTKTEDDSSIVEGKTKVTTEGKNGKDRVTYQVTYTDGKETAREEVDRETLQKPVTEVIKKGTAVSYNGKLYKKKITVRAYSYTGGGRTASGTRARVGEIAVDPRVIPLGTEVYIPGVGDRRAEDTGGNIKGNTIDIYMNSVGACRQWGCRTVTVYFK